MKVTDLLFALMAVSPVLAVVIIALHVALSVWSGQRMINSLQTSRAAQTAERCDRWAIECDDARARAFSGNQDQDTRSWWRRGLSCITRRFSGSKGMQEELEHRCEVSSCKATGDAEVCPMYFEQLRLLTGDAPPAGAASPPPAGPPDPKPNTFRAFIRDAYRKPHTGVGPTADRLLKGASKVGKSIGPAIGRVAKGTWSKIKKGVAATRRRESPGNKSIGGEGSLTSGKHSSILGGITANRLLTGGSKAGKSTGRAVGRVAKGAWSKIRKVGATIRSGEIIGDRKDVKGERSPTGEKPNNNRGGGGSGDRKASRFACFHGHRPHCQQAPAIFNPAPDHEARVLSAQRALEGHDANAVRLSFRLNVLALATVGLWFYVKTRGRLRPWRWQQRRRGQRRLGERDRAGVARRICSDNGGSVRGRSSVAEYDEREAISQLARARGNPFVSKGAFARQQGVAEIQEHIVDDNDRLVPTRGSLRNNAGRDVPAATVPQQEHRQHVGRLSTYTPPPMLTIPPLTQRVVMSLSANADAETKTDVVEMINTPPPLQRGARTHLECFSAAGSPSPNHTNTGNSNDIAGGCWTAVVDKRFEQIPLPPGESRVKDITGSGGKPSGAEFREEVWADGGASCESEQKYQDGDGSTEDRSLEEEKCEQRQDGTVVEARVRNWGKHNGVTLYAVEINISGQREARKVYRRYTHFLGLWEEVCIDHPSLRAFSFPSKDALFSTRGLLAGVLGGRRIEEERRGQFCHLLQLIMKLEPRPLALLTFLDFPPPDGASAGGKPSAQAPAPALALASAPGATTDGIQKGRNGVEMEHDMQGQEEQKVSRSPRSARGRTINPGSPQPQQFEKQQQQQQQQQQQHEKQQGQARQQGHQHQQRQQLGQRHQDQRQHLRGGAVRLGFPPAGSNRSMIARASRNNIAGPTATAAAVESAGPASVAAEGDHEGRAAPFPGDLALGIFLLSLIGVIIVDVFAVLLYTLGVASSSSPCPVLSLSPTLILFLTVCTAGPAAAVTLVARVFCFCQASWVTDQLGLRPFQLPASVCPHRHRAPARPVWRPYWRRSFRGLGIGTAGTVGGTNVGVRGRGAIGPGGTRHSRDDTNRLGGPVGDCGSIGDDGAIGVDGAIGSVAVVDGGNGGDCNGDGRRGRGSFGEGRENSRSRSRSPGRWMTAGRARALSGARSPGRPSIHGQRG